MWIWWTRIRIRIRNTRRNFTFWDAVLPSEIICSQKNGSKILFIMNSQNIVDPDRLPDPDRHPEPSCIKFLLLRTLKNCQGLLNVLTESRVW
jgi:hypothetical protein